MKITEETIAREAGVSKASVSRYFNPIERDKLKPETRDRIQPVVQEHDFEPEKRSAKKRKYQTGVFGVLVPYSADLFESPYHRGVLSGIMAAMENSSYEIRLIPVRDDGYGNIRRFLQKYLVDGLIILTWRSHPNLIKLVESVSKPFPIILINDFDETVYANFAYCDVGEGMAKAVGYLADKGKRRIAFLKGPVHNKIGFGETAMSIESIDSRQKYEGFRGAMKANDLEIREDWIKECSCYVSEEGFKKASELFAGDKCPDSVICSNDALAKGVLDYLAEKGIKCPEEVSVIGFDGYEESEYTVPPLTTIKQPLKEMGLKAGELLVEISNGLGRHSGVVRQKFEPELVIRKSA
ncbi:MAG: hypothetical protein COW12_01695 [Candidatus Omnitrophica bacterium CG12_big_fil_rev_8_21_14_0_65_45_16]|nr:MAG: hypothetical protein COW12_01695 [Candidatus Omnitrophica bacterium CG12_big_fil_rev_8_21_14_0_65_45_16]